MSRPPLRPIGLARKRRNYCAILVLFRLGTKTSQILTISYLLLSSNQQPSYPCSIRPSCLLSLLILLLLPYSRPLFPPSPPTAALLPRRLPPWPPSRIVRHHRGGMRFTAPAVGICVGTAVAEASAGSYSGAAAVAKGRGWEPPPTQAHVVPPGTARHAKAILVSGPLSRHDGTTRHETCHIVSCHAEAVSVSCAPFGHL